MAMAIEPIGSIPTRPSLVEAGPRLRSGSLSQTELVSQHDSAVQDAVARFDASHSKVVAGREQAKKLAIYPIHGLRNGRDSDSSRGWQALVVSAQHVDGRSRNDS